MPYASIIETGRRKGAKMPKIMENGTPGPIVRWAQRRLGMSQKEAQSVAFVISRAIKRRGLVPRKVMERALPEVERLVREEKLHELDLEMNK